MEKPKAPSCYVCECGHNAFRIIATLAGEIWLNCICCDKVLMIQEAIGVACKAPMSRWKKKKLTYFRRKAAKQMPILKPKDER